MASAPTFGGDGQVSPRQNWPGLVVVCQESEGQALLFIDAAAALGPSSLDESLEAGSAGDGVLVFRPRQTGDLLSAASDAGDPCPPRVPVRLRLSSLDGLLKLRRTLASWNADGRLMVAQWPRSGCWVWLRTASPDEADGDGDGRDARVVLGWWLQLPLDTARITKAMTTKTAASVTPAKERAAPAAPAAPVQKTTATTKPKSSSSPPPKGKSRPPNRRDKNSTSQSQPTSDPRSTSTIVIARAIIVSDESDSSSDDDEDRFSQVSSRVSDIGSSNVPTAPRQASHPQYVKPVASAVPKTQPSLNNADADRRTEEKLSKFAGTLAVSFK